MMPVTTHERPYHRRDPSARGDKKKRYMNTTSRHWQQKRDVSGNKAIDLSYTEKSINNAYDTHVSCIFYCSNQLTQKFYGHLFMLNNAKQRVDSWTPSTRQ